MWGRTALAVRQEVLLHVVRVALEHGRGAAQVADLLVGPLDHPVTLAGLGVNDLAGASDLEALFRARLRLQLGHLALLGSALRSGLKPPFGLFIAALSKTN